MTMHKYKIAIARPDGSTIHGMVNAMNGNDALERLQLGGSYQVVSIREVSFAEACQYDREFDALLKANDDSPWKEAEATDASVQNPNCDGSGPCSAGEVRFLATGRCSMDGGVILCRSCFLRELEWRKGRNKTLADDCKFRLMAWESLPIYGGSGGLKTGEPVKPILLRKGWGYTDGGAK